MATKKWCFKCDEWKNSQNFYKNRSKPDGLSSFCIECGKTKFGKTLKCSKCGVEFKINHRNVSKRKSFDCRECAVKASAIKTAERNRNNSTGMAFHERGYLYIHDAKEKHGYIFAHRKVMATHIGRPLTRNEIVHHVDLDKRNNAIENLWLTDNSRHSKAHRSLEKLSLELLKKGEVVFDREQGIYKWR